MSTTTSPVIDLLATSSFAHGQPHDQFAWLRANAPVYRHPEPDGPGFWAVTRYDDVRAVGKDAARFSSEPTIMIGDPAPDSASLSGDHKMMVMSDPPYHTGLRRLLSREFTPRRARELLGRIEALATQIVDEVIEAGSCDLVADLAGEMPSYVIAELMGLPLDDGRKLYELTEILHSAPDAVEPGAQAAAIGEMFGYATQVIADKRANPGDDLSSALLAAEVDGRRLDDLDFGLFFMLLIDAGGDTTRNLVAGGFHALLTHPDQLAALRADVDGLLPTAIEEMLRWVSPVVYMRRTATVDTTLAGQPIAAGDKVVMYYGSANRDESVFAAADTFDITRSPNHHVAFGGGGPHFCLGANLARVEIEALCTEMLTRLDDLALAGPVEYLASTFISGPRTMPVTFRPAV